MMKFSKPVKVQPSKADPADSAKRVALAPPVNVTVDVEEHAERDDLLTVRAVHGQSEAHTSISLRGDARRVQELSDAELAAQIQADVDAAAQRVADRVVATERIRAARALLK